MKIRRSLAKRITFFIPFAAGIALGLSTWSKLSLPFRNPWNVTGRLTELAFNPASNVLRFLALMIWPSLLLAVLMTAGGKRIRELCFRDVDSEDDDEPASEGSARLRATSAAFLVVLAVAGALNFPTVGASGPLDTFHEGETLGPSVSYFHGGVPFLNFLPIHGLYLDPLRSVLAFRFFGRSIGAVRTLESLSKVVVFACVALFVLKMNGRRRILAVWTIVIFLSLILGPKALLHSEGNLLAIVGRDLPVFLFLIAALSLGDHLAGRASNRAALSAIGFALGFVPIASLAYSVDRGVYLAVTSLLVVLTAHAVFFGRTQRRPEFIAASLTGFAAGSFLLVSLMGRGFGEFVRYSFLILPRYKDLMDGFVFPIEKPRYFLTLIIMAGNAFWVTSRMLGDIHRSGGELGNALRRFLSKNWIETILLVLSFALFRNALNRSDGNHLAYSSPITALLAIRIVLTYQIAPLLDRLAPAAIRRRAFAGAAVVSAIILTGWSFREIARSGLISDNFPLRRTDADFIPADVARASEFLRSHLGPGESFYALTNEASWYYFTGIVCPSRFLVPLFAMPDFYQREIIRDLTSEQVRFVLYRNRNWSNSIDGIPNRRRLPLLFDYVDRTFEPYEKIGEHEIWARKAKQPA